MNNYLLLNVTCYGLGILGGISLAICPFAGKGRLAPHWIRVALWMAGPIAIAWGCLGFILVFEYQSLSASAYRLVRHYKELSAGSGLGILVLLFASGEFIRAFSRKKSTAP